MNAFSTEISPQIYNPLSIFSVPGSSYINRNGFLNLDSLVALVLYLILLVRKYGTQYQLIFRFYKRPNIKLVKVFKENR